MEMVINMIYKMKKSFLVALLALATALPAAASDIEAKFEGMFDFNAGARSQKKVPADKKLTGNQKNSGLNTYAFFAVTASSRTDNFEYGAKIVAQPTAQASSGVSSGGSHIFLIREDLGKIELGSGFDAASQMMITGLDVARGTGDGWSDYAYFSDETSPVPSPYGFFLGGGSFKNNNTESSRKISYFTPSLNGFRFGISYIPDTGNMGSTAMGDVDYVTKKARTVYTDDYKYTEKKTAKNAVAAGISLEHDIAEDVAVKVALTGEYGKAAKPGVRENVDKDSTKDPKDVLANTAVNYKLSSMRTYNIGAVLTYGNFSYGASYGNVKGFTSREVDGNKNKTSLYSTAIGYTQGPVGVSLSYLLTDARKNKVDAVTIGTDYKLAPGLVPYAELTYFKGRMHKLPVFSDPTKYTTKGTIALIGMKLKF